MTQTGPDLVGAGLPTSNIWTALLGGSTNIANPNVPARSNLEWFGLGATLIATTAIVASGSMVMVPVPVTPGLTITNVQVLTTATAASVPTHQWAALYAGTGSAPAFLAQSTDTTTAAIGANAWVSWTLSPYTLSSASTQCPNGFIYVGIGITATTVATSVSALSPTTAAYYTPVLTSTASTVMPLFIAATMTAAGATAPTTIASTSAAAQTPIVVLR